MKTQKKLYAIAPDGCESYLTPNKEYEVLEISKPNFKMNYTRYFSVINDSGIKLNWCLEFECCHLNNRNWKIIEK